MARSPGYIPGPLVIPGVTEIILEWAQPNGKNAHNVLHANNTFGAPLNSVLCNNILAAIGGMAEWTAYAAVLNSNWSLNAIKMRSLDVALAPQFESTGASFLGTATTGALPEAVAMVVTLKSAVAGRSGRGRVYLTGFDSSFVDGNGHATPTITAACDGLLFGIMRELDTVGFQLCIANRAHSDYISPSTGATVPAAPAGSQIVEFARTQDNVFDSQRRRK